MTDITDSPKCELCTPTDVVLQNALAYVRYDNNSLSRGHVLAISRRHVASFFDMSKEEQVAVLELLGEAQRHIQRNVSPDGYNIGVNIGVAGGNHACTSTFTSSHATPVTSPIQAGVCAACSLHPNVTPDRRKRGRPGLPVSRACKLSHAAQQPAWCADQRGSISCAYGVE